MRKFRSSRTMLVATAASACFATSAAASAQEQTTNSAQDTDQPAAISEDAQRVYLPEDFAQFAPRTARDMVSRIPGFDLDEGDNQGQRGLGQADGNVLVNGSRLANKSDSVADQLGRISASNVLRIEIVDGNTLDIPGISGLVANIIVSSSSALSGQFRWNPQYRPTTNRFLPFFGNASISGSLKDMTFNLGIENQITQRYGSDGPATFIDGNGVLIEDRDTIFRRTQDTPTIKAGLQYTSPADTTVNLNTTFVRKGFDVVDLDRRRIVDDVDRERDRFLGMDGYFYAINGELEFDLGHGRLKLISVISYDKEKRTDTAVFTFADSRAREGLQFRLDQDARERIGRAEYTWQMLGADWQLSGEAAFNSLDTVNELFELDADERFSSIPLPGGIGGVSEDRYEGALSASGTLAEGLTIQAIGGAEVSTLTQSGEVSSSRRFSRPKGSLSLGWQANDKLQISLELARKVGQLNFGDFLSSVSFVNDTANSGNADLRPQQSWEIDLETTLSLGQLGDVNLLLFQQFIEDRVDFIQLSDGSFGVGNIESARRTGIEASATFKLDTLGWRGARIDFEGEYVHSRLTDPVNGLKRRLGGDPPHQFEVELRYDIPETDWALGSSVQGFSGGTGFRQDQFFMAEEGPEFWNIYAENKDMLGLTVRGEILGIFGPVRTVDRVVFDGIRGIDPISLVERRDQKIGRVFSVVVEGSF